MISALPTALRMSMAPPVPNRTTTTADEVFPAVGFRFDVPVKLPPTGHAEM
jgi:hypothetical protein